MRDKAITRAVKAAGTMDKLAIALGISCPAISQWKRIPPGRLVDIERITGIPREELRPDLYRQPPEAA
jgi:DNA-binding transcriptional regulator YdaS (Cro superfamily)